MAIGWFDVEDKCAFLVASKIDGKWRVAWQIGLDVAFVVGAQLPLNDGPMAVADILVRPWAVGHTAPGDAYEFASELDAEQAVIDANTELQRLWPIDVPPWAAEAITCGWAPVPAPAPEAP